MKRTVRWCALVCVTLIASACGSGGDGQVDPTPAKAKTTLLVYMIGSNLESDFGAATGNLEEMMSVGSTSDVNVVVQTGGANKDGWRTVQRKKVLKGSLELVGDVGTPPMGVPATLRDFIKWGTATYPAERTMLVLWNHGGGPNGGFGGDENVPAGSPDGILTVAEMEVALREARTAGGPKLEMIGFDACLMASVEVAAALAPHAKYMIASEEVEPGAGWDWQALVKYLTGQPLTSGAALGQVTVDSYFAKMQREQADAIVTSSVVDLGRVPMLVDALADFAKGWTARLDREGGEAWKDLTFARRRALDFQTEQIFYSDLDMVDIGSFLDQASISLPDGSDERVRSAVKAAVLHQVSGSAVEIRPSGLTMYFPTQSIYNDRTLKTYRALDFSAPVQNWVDRYVQMARNKIVQTPEVSQLQSQGDQATASISNTNYVGSFASLENAADHRVYALKPVNAQPDARPTGGGVLQTSVDTGWPTIGGVPVLMLPDETSFDVDNGLHMVPVAIFNPDETDPAERYTEGLLNVRFTRDLSGKAHYDIVAFTPAGFGSSLYVPRGVPLEPGMVLVPMGFDINQKNWFVRNSATFTVPQTVGSPGGWTLAHSKLPVAGSSMRFGVVDLTSKTQFSMPLLR